jgi:hypothetical protein
MLSGRKADLYPANYPFGPEVFTKELLASDEDRKVGGSAACTSVPEGSRKAGVTGSGWGGQSTAMMASAPKAAMTRRATRIVLPGKEGRLARKRRTIDLMQL